MRRHDQDVPDSDKYDQTSIFSRQLSADYPPWIPLQCTEVSYVLGPVVIRITVEHFFGAPPPPGYITVVRCCQTIHVQAVVCGFDLSYHNMYFFF